MEQKYWENRYKNNETGWDAGSITTPIKEFVDQLKDKNIKILIPGAGNSHEAEYLFNNGFTNVFVLDVVQEPLQNFKNRVPNFPENNLICEDFFTHKGSYDLILEQTFFCAISPKDRKRYVEKVSELLAENGKLVGVFFNFPLDVNSGPPFGGSKEEYLELFGKDFKIQIEECNNSIKPRVGKEFFVSIS